MEENSKERLRQLIKAQTETFLAKGGYIAHQEASKRKDTVYGARPTKRSLTESERPSMSGRGKLFAPERYTQSNQRRSLNQSS